MAPDPTPPLTVLYDGHCSLCVRSAAALERLDRKRGRIRMVDFRTHPAPAADAGITPDALEGAMHAIHPDRRITKGPDAVRDALRAVGWRWAARLLALPLIGPVFARVYDTIARNRLRWFARKAVAPGAAACEHGTCRADPKPRR